jgi:hypothetical protein
MNESVAGCGTRPMQRGGFFIANDTMNAINTMIEPAEAL